MKIRENVKLKGKERVPQNSANGVVDGTDSSSSAESKLISAILTGINRALPFAGTDSAKLDEHMDTLFRITHEASFNVSIQSLMLIQRVAETKTSVHARYFRTLYASLQDHRLAASSKQAMYLNLLFKSLKMDNNNARVKAFVKRFLQALATGPGYEPSFICGGLFLLGELFTITPGLRKAVSSLPESADSYDPKKREPEYSGAASSCIWELVPLLYHYHPSVSLHARQLLEDSPLTANADLALNTLSHFLDLFVYKNPKKPKPRGPSAMQPAAALGNDGNATVRLIKGISYGGLGSKGTVNEEDFWKKKVQDVPANQLFFHKFFNQRQQRSQHIREKVEKRKGRGDAENNIDWDGAESTVLGKRKKHGKQTAERDDGRKRKKRRLKDLPLFASMEDYEALIDAEPEDNI
ncbi:hypothetical protein FRC20_006311 [Serendipita sp. 405]|nr:hypothetical protein FRC20_006311 [Serendipita sp. 405]